MCITSKKDCKETAHLFFTPKLWITVKTLEVSERDAHLRSDEDKSLQVLRYLWSVWKDEQVFCNLAQMTIWRPYCTSVCKSSVKHSTDTETILLTDWTYTSEHAECEINITLVHYYSRMDANVAESQRADQTKAVLSAKMMKCTRKEGLLSFVEAQK